MTNSYFVAHFSDQIPSTKTHPIKSYRSTSLDEEPRSFIQATKDSLDHVTAHVTAFGVYRPEPRATYATRC